jgi:hypothetical protein
LDADDECTDASASLVIVCPLLLPLRPDDDVVALLHW